MRAGLVVLCGCATSYQSARVLERGRTEVTVGLTRAQLFDDSVESGDRGFLGDVQVRRGFGHGLDAGVRLQRTPSRRDAASVFQLEPRLALTAPERPLALALALSAGVAWAEVFDPADGGQIEIDHGFGVFGATALVGFEATPRLELVLAPRAFATTNGKATELHVGVSLGLRVGDLGRRWAIHPEIGILRLTEGPDDDTLLTFGIALAAGN